MSRPALFRRVFQWQKIAVLVSALFLALVVVFVIETTRTFRISQERLETRLSVLENENQGLTADKEKATAQANTSADQLVKSGETPIIAAPDVLTVPTQAIPTTSTTATTAAPVPPVLIFPPATPTVPPTAPPTTEAPPATEPPTTQPPSTEAPPSTTQPPPVSESPPVSETTKGENK